jgi:hypothetical protein
MSQNAGFASVLLLTAGAAVGLVPTYLIARRKERRDLAVRWDSAPYELCQDFAAAIREFVHLADRRTNKEQHAARVDEQQAQLRELAQQMRLLGSKDLQQAARAVAHHVWWVREARVVRTRGRDTTQADRQRFVCASRCTRYTLPLTPNSVWQIRKMSLHRVRKSGGSGRYRCCRVHHPRMAASVWTAPD